jgi:SAM-dependent methyltransferase
VGLELTGERTLPGIAHENYWFRRHEAAYRFAAARCAGLAVLDAGCGEGYGSAILAETARRVLGIDLVADACAHAQAAYPDASFVEADLCALPLADACAGAVVSLQAIEHLWDIPRYLDETARVLRPGGLFVCGTPNRLTFGGGDGGPANPFHSVEFTAEELAGLLATRFARVEVLGVFHRRRLEHAEAARGARLPGMLLAAPPEAWPAWLGALVASVTVDDFEVTADRPVDDSLDLIAVARTEAAG